MINKRKAFELMLVMHKLLLDDRSGTDVDYESGTVNIFRDDEFVKSIKYEDLGDYLASQYDFDLSEYEEFEWQLTEVN